MSRDATPTFCAKKVKEPFIWRGRRWPFTTGSRAGRRPRRRRDPARHLCAEVFSGTKPMTDRVFSAQLRPVRYEFNKLTSTRDFARVDQHYLKVMLSHTTKTTTWEDPRKSLAAQAAAAGVQHQSDSLLAQAGQALAATAGDCLS
ncbi:hypothetical protein EVAR_76276_1 [Eumeta japonica]|uniref:WW domain-containing protein n=1 Tax=Eumeta variegata TaxID=151549 RepID=A0A4C1UNZ4_EUMVA|nr:hypothetical protein EVAR_76276_1 [Eumeta japonica]